MLKFALTFAAATMLSNVAFSQSTPSTQSPANPQWQKKLLQCDKIQNVLNYVKNADEDIYLMADGYFPLPNRENNIVKVKAQFILFRNKENGTFTLAQFHANGRGCIMGIGDKVFNLYERENDIEEENKEALEENLDDPEEDLVEPLPYAPFPKELDRS